MNTTTEQMQKYIGITVGDLIDFIATNNINKDSKIFVERVEDKYFEHHNWDVVEKYNEGEQQHHQYHIAWSCVKYNDEEGTLFIDLHY